MCAHVLPELARPAVTTVVSAVLCLVTAGTTLGAPGPSTAGKPTLSVDRTILTTPFAGSKRSVKDHEGSAFVRRDNSLWLADDDGTRLYEINVKTGSLKRSIGEKALESVSRFHGQARAGARRVGDLESLAYDAKRDRLYAFSGSCCKPSVRPTVIRLTRQSGELRLDSYRALPRGSENTAAAWNPRSRRIYTGNEGTIRRYSYKKNDFGKRIHVPRLDDILGMGFSADGKDLYVARYDLRLSRVDWTRKALVRGWTIALRQFKVRDARAVEVIRGRLFVSDGYDLRPERSRLRYAVFVLDPTG